jgi:hypothetical protein
MMESIMSNHLNQHTGGNGAGYHIDELPEEVETSTVKESPAAAADKFKKFAEMRRDPKSAMAPVSKRLTSIPARTPHKNWFVRTSTNPNHQGTLTLFWDKGGDGLPYLVDPACHDFLEGVRSNYCVLSITRQGLLFLWCGPLENEEGEWNSWHASAHDMKSEAAGSWISIRANKQMGGYDLIEPVAAYPDPKFPDSLTWHEIINLAFRRHLIETEDHPVIKRILGAV